MTLTSFFDSGPTGHEFILSEPLQETLTSPTGDTISISDATVRLDSIFLASEPTKETLGG